MDSIVRTPVPNGLKPRLLDFASSHVGPEMSRLLFKAQHFSLGLEASEEFVFLCADYLEDIANDIAVFAPHPYENYTFSFWTGDEYSMIENLVIFFEDGPDRTPASGMLSLRWGEKEPRNGFAVLDRNIALGEIPVKESSLEKHLPSCLAAWKLGDVFRLMMAKTRGVTINKGGPPRAAMRKGKRVHFYSASQITIDLDAVKKAKVNFNTGHGKSPCAYQYRAHLCHSGGLPSCVHEWIEIGGRMDQNGIWHPDAEHPRTNATWECYHCGRRRWHRRAGMRGDASIGYSKQTYRIVKGKEDRVP